MKPTLVDTDILSLFFRGHAGVVARFAEYAEEHGSIAIAVISYYEVLSGLRHRDARRQFEVFHALLPPTASCRCTRKPQFMPRTSTPRPARPADLSTTSIC